ncbi:VOC family protein [Neorhizobium sp. DAR64861/K0K2]|uniref:VOC family protein n=1 Tax=Neorhizobium sp. DAR64861/K0K2 TaxID=3421956 RepID=UPI003D2ADD9E
MQAPLLNLIVIRASNPPELAEFYGNMGFEFQSERHGTGPEHLSSHVGGSVFEIYPRTPASADTTAVRLGFIVDSIARVLQRLGSHADIVSAPRISEWGTRCVLRDPEGHKVELLEA